MTLRRGLAWTYRGLLAGGLLAQVVAVAIASPALSLAGLVAGALADLLTSDERSAFRRRLRNVGLGLVPRVFSRALLLVAAVAQAAPTASAGVYAIGLLAVIAAVQAHRLVLRRLLGRITAWGAHNLGAAVELGPRLAGWRRRRTIGAGLLCGLEVPLGVAVAGDALGRFTPGAVLTTAGVVVGVAVAGLAVEVIDAARNARAEPREVHEEALRAAITASGAEVVLYFSGGARSTYQLRQWVPVIERLSRPVLYVLREEVHLSAVAGTRWPVLVAKQTRDVELALAGDPKVVLYVANAGKNLHLLRYHRPKHVFLNHGDSDKASSANPVVRVYDRLFVAGEIAIDRYRTVGIDLPDDRFAIVGRPQLDEVLDRGQRIDGGPPTLLYAPTWEGYFEVADYSSLERLGERLIGELLRSCPELRIVFKPHPLSGRVRPEAATAIRSVEAMLRDAGPPHVNAREHPDLDLLAWFDRCDVLLADISAVVTDFLHTDKPYLVTNPRGFELEEFHRQFPSHTAAYVVAPDGRDVAPLVGRALADDPLAAARRELKHRVLGEHPNGPLAAFEGALADMVARASDDRVPAHDR